MSLFDQVRQLDERDSVAHFRGQFHVPKDTRGGEVSYLVGNSLGLQPVRTESYIQRELRQWSELAVRAHFEGEFPWMPYHEFLSEPMAELIGAQPAEVVVMNSLTVNLHLMLASFYQPTRMRHKILIEHRAFPSDRYAVESQIQWHGFNVADSLVVAAPNDGNSLFDEESVCELIAQHGSSIAVVLLPAVHYYTGQWLDTRTIAETAHRYGCVIGLDLAHAAGNVPLNLHADQIDFAVWCTYKYLNSGPGSVGGCFVHQRHHMREDLPRLAGWWGHDKATRFQMPERFLPIPTAESWQVSNPPILSLAAIRAALQVFHDAGGMRHLREKSVALTGALQRLLEEELRSEAELLTPSQPERRGCQLSLVLHARNGREIQSRLEQHGIITDWREPNVLRVAPVPLYNSYDDVARFVEGLRHCLRKSG